jgi:hypothetical protein
MQPRSVVNDKTKERGQASPATAESLTPCHLIAIAPTLIGKGECPGFGVWGLGFGVWDLVIFPTSFGKGDCLSFFVGRARFLSISLRTGKHCG